MWRRSYITKTHTSQSFKNCAQRHWLTNSRVYYSFLEKGWIKCLLLCTQNHWHLNPYPVSLGWQEPLSPSFYSFYHCHPATMRGHSCPFQKLFILHIHHPNSLCHACYFPIFSWWKKLFTHNRGPHSKLNGTHWKTMSFSVTILWEADPNNSQRHCMPVTACEMPLYDNVTQTRVLPTGDKLN